MLVKLTTGWHIFTHCHCNEIYFKALKVFFNLKKNPLKKYLQQKKVCLALDFLNWQTQKDDKYFVNNYVYDNIYIFIRLFSTISFFSVVSCSRPENVMHTCVTQTWRIQITNILNYTQFFFPTDLFAINNSGRKGKKYRKMWLYRVYQWFEHEQISNVGLILGSKQFLIIVQEQP